MNLAHLTINTNDLRTSPRAEVSAQAIAALAPWTRATRNKAELLPGGLHLAARAHRDDSAGLAQLDVWSGPAAQVAQAVIVWTPEGEAKVWPRIVDQSRRMGIIAAQLRKPDSVPWLAVALTPAAALLSADTLMALADLERCWAWAVLEGVA
jgi:hypothetical protein